MKKPDIFNSKPIKPFLLTLPVSIFHWEVSIAEIIPISLREANRFIETHHRHSGRAQGCKFCVALSDELGGFVALPLWDGLLRAGWTMAKQRR